MSYLRSAEAEPALREWIWRCAGHMMHSHISDGEVDMALRRMRWAFQDLPFFVAFAGLCARASAWCTSRRMMAEPNSCLWCCIGVGGDDVRHYLACLVFPRFARSARRRPPPWTGTGNMRSQACEVVSL